MTLSISLIRFFCEGLKPLVKALMEQRGRELDSWEKLVEKAIDAGAKASLQSQSILREMDQRCPRGNRPAYSTMARSQATSTQDLRGRDGSVEKPEPAPMSPNSLPAGSSEISNKKSWKEKKKQQRLDQLREQARKDSTPGTDVNTPRMPSGARTLKDLSHITCFNCGE